MKNDDNKKISKEEFDALTEKHMNPVPAEDFDPATFDPMKLNDHPHSEVGARERVTPPKRLPTMGLKPKKVREGQMVGMFESKQDLYLLIAEAYERIATLEEKLQGAVRPTPASDSPKPPEASGSPPSGH
jgi:hypothetical protein